MASSDASIDISHVALTVRDLAGVAEYYRRILGFETLSDQGGILRLGAGGRVLLELRADPAARPHGPREAGLFHTAFLLPSRADLGAWIRMASDNRLPVQGASDHLVSEAVYLADPEGNGIEIYTDRPRADWPRNPDGIAMATEPMDIPGVAASATAPWAGAPAGTVVGHVHLQVGDLAKATAFYGQDLGLALTSRYPGANFFGWDGYHHHFGTNTWHSRGAGLRKAGETGLSEVVLSASAPALADLRARLGQARIDDGLQDPWGTRFSVAARAA